MCVNCFDQPGFRTILERSFRENLKHDMPHWPMRGIYGGNLRHKPLKSP